MLVHIPTMGCLITVWKGKFETYSNVNGTSIEIPKYENCFFNNTFLENPEDWQEVNDNSALGKKLKKYYPNVIPVFNEMGILIDVRIIESEKKQQEKELIKQQKKEENKKRGYSNRTNLRPKNLLPFLQID